MKVPFNNILHLELFAVGGEEFIKDSANPKKGNAMRRFGKRDYVFLPPETLVRRKEPDIPFQKLNV